MAITIGKKLAPSDYIPASEHDIQRDDEGKELSRTPKSGASVFRLRPLTELELLEVWPDTEHKGDNIVLKGPACRRLLAVGVVGWSGVRDADGKALPFSTEALLDGLRSEDIIDIAYEVLRRSVLTDDERKNSASQST